MVDRVLRNATDAPEQRKICRIDSRLQTDEVTLDTFFDPGIVPVRFPEALD